MTLHQSTESVVACDACGFAGLVGSRLREWVPYRLAACEERWVRFAVCTACGVSCAGPHHGGGPLSRQPAPLTVRAGRVVVVPWEAAPPGGGCPACGAADGLLWSALDPASFGRVLCPVCWSGPLRVTEREAIHPEW